MFIAKKRDWFGCRKFGALILCAFLLLSLNSCAVAPLLEPLRKGGFTAESRRALLPPRVQLFHRLVAENKIEDALTLVTSESRDEVRAALEEIASGFTITGAEIKRRVDTDSASQSNLEVSLQRYKVGRNTLEDVALSEVWEFGHAQGWLLSKIEESTFAAAHRSSGRAVKSGGLR
jgi:hypothetical protein